MPQIKKIGNLDWVFPKPVLPDEERPGCLKLVLSLSLHHRSGVDDELYKSGELIFEKGALVVTATTTQDAATAKTPLIRIARYLSEFYWRVVLNYEENHWPATHITLHLPEKSQIYMPSNYIASIARKIESFVHKAGI